MGRSLDSIGSVLWVFWQFLDRANTLSLGSEHKRKRAGHKVSRYLKTLLFIWFFADVKTIPSREPEIPCRPRCSACCIAPSISSAIPGMPSGKPAGVPCVQLDDQGFCRLFGLPERPAVCSSLRPTAGMCGGNREQAMAYLGELERLTS
jgi:hypothetical protein